MSNVKMKKRNRRPQLRFRSFVISTLSFVLAAYAADVGGLMRQGNSLYNRGKYDEALSRYQMAEVLEPDATTIHFNLGNTLFRLGRYQEAARELELVMIDKKPARRANALYNTGNVAFKAGQLDAAIKAYTGALAINPSDKQAKQNLEFCLKKKQEQQNQPDSSQQKQQQNQQQQQQQQPQQQQQQQQQQPQQGMDKNQAERIVQAVENKEKEEQKKQHQATGGKKQVELDW
jgi:Ca-activated chloride channel family protein